MRCVSDTQGQRAVSICVCPEEAAQAGGENVAFQPTVMPDAVGTPGREHGRKRGEASAEPWQTGALEGWAEEEVLQRRPRGGKHSRRAAEKAGVTEAGPQEPAEGPCHWVFLATKGHMLLELL